MNVLTIDVPPALQHWVETRLAEGRFADAGEYLRDLIRRDQDGLDDEDEQDVAEIRALVDEGLASGVADAEPREVLRRIIAGASASHG